MSVKTIAKKVVSERDLKRALKNLRSAGVDKWEAVDAVTDQWENRGVTYQMVSDLAKNIFKE